MKMHNVARSDISQ